MFKKTAYLTLFFTFAFASVASAQLQTRDSRSNHDYYGYSQPNVVPAGTTFLIKLDDSLDTKNLKAGKKFDAKLGEDLVAPNGEIIPRGKKLHGRVSDVQKGAGSMLVLNFYEIETRRGWVPLIATLVGTPGEKSVKVEGREGEITRNGGGARRAVRNAAIGAAAGAVTGAVVGGSRGALIGAAAGGGIGLTTALIGNGDFKLEKGQQMELRLDRGLQVPSH